MTLSKSYSQSRFVHNIIFKGVTNESNFKGHDFDVSFKNGEFIISKRQDENSLFVIKRTEDSIHDLVFSSGDSAVALAMSATDRNSRNRALVTIDSEGKKRVFEYKAYEMTKELGWVVELGSVSNDGSKILAKCAYLLPEDEEGRSHVQHQWAVLQIVDDAISILDSSDAINKWHKYSLSK